MRVLFAENKVRFARAEQLWVYMCVCSSNRFNMLKLKPLYEIEHVPVVEANHRWDERWQSLLLTSRAMHIGNVSVDLLTRDGRTVDECSFRHRRIRTWTHRARETVSLVPCHVRVLSNSCLKWYLADSVAAGVSSRPSLCNWFVIITAVHMSSSACITVVSVTDTVKWRGWSLVLDAEILRCFVLT